MLRSNESLRGMQLALRGSMTRATLLRGQRALRGYYVRRFFERGSSTIQLTPQVFLCYKIAMMNAMTNNHEADGASGVRGVVRHGLELKHFRRHVFE
jgi:hypothetical protein